MEVFHERVAVVPLVERVATRRIDAEVPLVVEALPQDSRHRGAVFGIGFLALEHRRDGRLVMERRVQVGHDEDFEPTYTRLRLRRSRIAVLRAADLSEPCGPRLLEDHPAMDDLPGGLRCRRRQHTIRLHHLGALDAPLKRGVGDRKSHV